MRSLPLALLLASLPAAAHGPDSHDPAPPAAPAADAADGSAAADEEGDKKKVDWSVEGDHGPSHTVSLDLTEGTWMSPAVSGDRIVFDLLGDLWTIPLAGGDAVRLTTTVAWESEPRWSPDGRTIAYVTDEGGNEQLWLMDSDGKNRRQLTDEGVARVTDPVWDPNGTYILGRKRTIDTRSIGVTELWQYHLDGGKGFQLTKLEDHPHAGEAALSTDGRYLYFSSRSSRFEYNHNPLQGLWRIVRMDRETGEQVNVVHGSGSAARPTLSSDGKTLFFVSRDRTKTLLERVDLATGRRLVVADWLSPDQMEAFALHAVYPHIAVVPGPQGDALILWSQGKLWRVAADGSKTAVPFRAKGDWKLQDVPRWPAEVPDQVRAKVLRWPTWNAAGDVAFSAMGQLWLQRKGGAPERLSTGTGYAPAWSPDGGTVAWTSWVDPTLDAAGMALPGDWGGALHLSKPGKGKGKLKDEVIFASGQVVNPAWDDKGERLVVLRGIGGAAVPGMYSDGAYEIVLLQRGKKGWTSQVVSTLGNVAGPRAPRLHLHDDRVWYLEDKPVEGRKPPQGQLVSVALDGTDKRVHLIFAKADELSISPDFQRVAWKADHQGYVTALPPGARSVDVDASLPKVELTEVVGDWLGWTPDSKSVTWAEGPTLKVRALSDLRKAEDDAPDPVVAATVIDLQVPRARPTSTIALTHARVLPMADSKGVLAEGAAGSVIEDATVVIVGDRIHSVTAGGAVPAGALILDCTGKTIIPGLIDVHAHLHYTAGDVLPEQEWRYLTSLDYGVTTVQDPSASTDLVFTQAERVEVGLEKGPRVYSTGFVLYGALSNQGAETPDPDAARHHVERLALVGANSVKVYQQSQRERRQWYVQACNEQQILCVPEGGGDLWMNLSMVVDGFHAIEHTLPVAPFYADVRGLFTASGTTTSRADGADTTVGTSYTPTLLVAYGGVSGENYFYKHENPVDDPRLLRHFPRRDLDAQAFRWDLMVRDDDFQHQKAAAELGALQAGGVNVGLGAHGQLQGLGAHWELWALAGPGAMSPYNALRAATWGGARYLGMEADIGTVRPGGFADLVVLDADPLLDIQNSDNISFVIKNGEVVR